MAQTRELRPEHAGSGTGENFDDRLEFDDRSPEDLKLGPARVVDVSGRCADCWGPIAGRKDASGRWSHIECLLCGRSVDEEKAEREVEAMEREAHCNMAAARVGQPARYRANAGFVLKLLPDMDRDVAKVERRIKVSLAEGRKRGRLTRHEFPPGTAGYLYAQAIAFLAGVENLSREKAAFALTDLEYGEPQPVGIDGSAGDGTIHVTGRIPAIHRKPSNRGLMARIGTALVAGTAGAFACEVGMKALLVTRLDGAAKTHDLLALYGELPSDSRDRLEGDFPEIAEVLAHSRQTFGKWRYFEQGYRRGRHPLAGRYRPRVGTWQGSTRDRGRVLGCRPECRIRHGHDVRGRGEAGRFAHVATDRPDAGGRGVVHPVGRTAAVGGVMV